MSQEEIVLDTAILRELGRHGVAAARTNIMQHVGNIKREIVETYMLGCTGSSGDHRQYMRNLHESGASNLSDDVVTWLKTKWEALLCTVCKGAVSQELNDEKSLLLYDRCLSSMLMAIVTVKDIANRTGVVKSETIDLLCSALSLLLEKGHAMVQQDPACVLGVFSNTFYSALKCLAVAGLDTNDAQGGKKAKENRLSALLRDFMQTNNIRLHNEPFLTYTDDSYALLYKLVQWGYTSPDLLTAICSNVYISHTRH